jgi:hypothetical protein
MHANSFDPIWFETQHRLDTRTKEAATERLANELRGETADAVVRTRTRSRWISWLHTPAFVRTSLLGAR